MNMKTIILDSESTTRQLVSRIAIALMFLCSFLVIMQTISCGRETLTAQPPILTGSTDMIDFGDVIVGVQEQRTLFLLNTGNNLLLLEEPEADTLGGVFAILLHDMEIPAQQDAIVRMVFIPGELGEFETKVAFPNNSRNQPRFEVTLKGTAVEANPCYQVECNTAPAGVCIDSNTSRHYEPIGVCDPDLGRCVYPELTPDEICQYGCDFNNGLCRTNPCSGINCNQPPAPLCISSSVSRIYLPAGTCNIDSGVCEYQERDETCVHGCDGQTGLCVGDPCSGVVCSTPPNDQCFAPQGSCVNGACVYTSLTSTCNDLNPCSSNDRCSAGTCSGAAIICNAAPSSQCLSDGMTQRKWRPVGTCQSGGTNAGSCRYDYDDISCQYGCNQGQCVGDLCPSGNATCDDGNPCTTDVCDTLRGCQYNNNANACVTSSGVCPTGQCTAGQCLAVSGLTCQTQIQQDLCASTTVPGVCTGAGTCVTNAGSAGMSCPECGNSICLQCTLGGVIPIRYCIGL